LGFLFAADSEERVAKSDCIAGGDFQFNQIEGSVAPGTVLEVRIPISKVRKLVGICQRYAGSY
jgi:hypothetical protein